MNQIDKLEMTLQAAIYEKQGFGDLTEFFEYVQTRIKEPKLKEILDETIKLRN